MGILWRVLFGLGIVAGFGPAQMAEGQSKVVRDVLWAWGNPEMTKPGQHTLATFASASPARRAELLGVPNVVIAGQGIPNDDEQADALTREVAASPHLVWEISADQGGGPPFVYTQRMSQVRKLVDKYPQIESVLLDDMSTVSIDKGFKPEHIRQIRQSLAGKYAAVKVWGVLYTMSFDRPGIDQYINELDVINLWTWDAKELVNLEKNITHCEQKYPSKPIMLGLYLYDYGGNRRIPLDIVRLQCDTALKLLHSGRIQGIVFLTINDDAEAVGWAADWVKRVGDEKLDSPSASAGALQLSTSANPVKLISLTDGASRLQIGDGSGWHFTDGAWTEAADGVISPPDRMNLHSRAFFTKETYGDLTAEFEVNGNYRETGTGGAGLVFRAADVNHFWFIRRKRT